MDTDINTMELSSIDNQNQCRFAGCQISAIDSSVFLKHLNSVNISLGEMQLPWQHDISTCPYQNHGNSLPSTEGNFYSNLGNQDCNSFKQFQILTEDEQLQYFLDSQNISKHNLISRWQFVLDTLIILRKYFPSCEVYPFGSLVTGLGDVSSDIDMFVDINGDGGKLIGEDPCGKETIILLRDEVMRIILESKCPHTTTTSFTENAKALGDRVPYLKFYHTPSNIECDLTFGNRLSLQNSRLIQFYMKLDDRVRPFLKVLLYWKNHGIPRNIKFRKYPLILLGLVYLIQKQIVPCVRFLQSLASEQRVENGISENSDEMDGWDGSFCDDVQLVKKQFQANQTKQSITGIVLNFLEMVMKTDFSTLVVCPLLGEYIPKSLLLTENSIDGPCGEDIPESWNSWAANQRNIKKKLNIDTPICIQDSFVLNDNVAILIDQDILKKFQNCCEQTVQRFLQNAKESGGNAKPDLLILFEV